MQGADWQVTQMRVRHTYQQICVTPPTPLPLLKLTHWPPPLRLLLLPPQPPPLPPPRTLLRLLEMAVCKRRERWEEVRAWVEWMRVRKIRRAGRRRKRRRIRKRRVTRRKGRAQQVTKVKGLLGGRCYRRPMPSVPGLLCLSLSSSRPPFFLPLPLQT